MEKRATIVTSKKEIAAAIRASVPNPVIEVDPEVIDLVLRHDHPGFSRSFEPAFQIMNPKLERTVRSLSGPVLCAVRPGLADGPLLYHCAHTFLNTRAELVYLPLHSLRAENIRIAIESAEQDQQANRKAFLPWMLTSIIARRITERIVGLKVKPLLDKHEIAYPGWVSLYHLFLADKVSRETWLRTLEYGSSGYRAYEVDSYGGRIYHEKMPKAFLGRFSVTTDRRDDVCYPDPRFPIRLMLHGSNADLAQARDQLETAYLQQECSWPFGYGVVDYREQPVEVYGSRCEILRRLPRFHPAVRTVRIYKHGRHLFRSVTYMPKTPNSFEPSNPFPKSRPAGQELDLRCPIHSKSPTVDRFLDHLASLQLNPDLVAISKLIHCDYIRQEKASLRVTDKGRTVMESAVSAGLSERRLYLILRLLESLQSNETTYGEVLGQIAETVGFDMRATSTG